MTDLFRHKSFFLLIFILILVDRGLKLLKNAYPVELELSVLQRIDAGAAVYLFDQLPEKLMLLLKDYRLFVGLIGLFLLKEVISLWPSSDMRRMHRWERGRFGIIASLGAIQWHQLVWDAVAVSSLYLTTVIWCLGWFWINRWGWQLYPSTVWLVLLFVSIGAILPVILAGFSYSSKLAVISRGTFFEKLQLFYKLFYDWRIAGGSWLFYGLRIIFEIVFVAAIPAYILITMNHFILRILFAAILATPAYSYLKMASFKFFLVLYERYPLVRQEYDTYYRQINFDDSQ